MTSPDRQGLITVCELGRLGDIVASEPIYRYLKKRYPDRRLRWYTREAYVELLKYSPAVDEIVTVRDAREYLALKRELPPGTLSYELNFRDPDAPRRRTGGGPADFPSLLRQFAADAGLDDVPDETPEFHFRPGLTLTDMPEKYVVFHCCSNGRSRQWPRRNFQTVAQMFQAAGYHVAEIGFQPMLDPSGPAYLDRTGKLDLQTAAKLIAGAQCFVGVESGFGHIANAVGTFAIIVTGKLRQHPDYVTYSGRFRRGENCNLVRFYDTASEELPLAVVREAVRRWLAGEPMSGTECRIFCLTEQVKQLRGKRLFRLEQAVKAPFVRLVRAIAFHRLRHGGKR